MSNPPPPPPPPAQGDPNWPHQGGHQPTPPPHGSPPPHPGGYQPTQPQPSPPPHPGGYQPERPGADDKSLAVLAHLSAPIAAVLSVGTLSILGPLVIWLVYKDRSELVRRSAAGAFNFNLAFWVVYLIALIFAVLTLGLGLLIAVPVWLVVFIVAAVAHIMGALRASRGEPFDYPFQIPVLR